MPAWFYARRACRESGGSHPVWTSPWPRRGQWESGRRQSRATRRDWSGGGLRRARGFAAEPLQEVLGIFHCPADARKLAVEILYVVQRLCQAGLADSAHASKPQDGMALPQLLDLPDPIVPFDHTAVELRWVLLNASTLAFGESSCREPLITQAVSYEDHGVIQIPGSLCGTLSGNARLGAGSVLPGILPLKNRFQPRNTLPAPSLLPFALLLAPISRCAPE